MFIRRKRSVQKSGEYEYLQIVESIRDGDKVRQKIIGTLGRSDKVRASGKIEALIRSLTQFAHHLKVVEASRTPDLQAVSSKEWGPALVFGSLWEKQGMPDLIRRLAEKRYVVCRNPVEAGKDKAAREAVLEKLQRTISEKGPKSVIGNRGYARFLRIAKGSVTINQEVVEADARLDGKFVLTTNTNMPAVDVALTYKSLWRVERTFREQKTTLEVRPISNQRDDTSIGHIVASFLALRLEVDLQRRLDEKGISVSWPDLMRDLARVHSVVVELEGTRYQLRTTMQGASLHAFQDSGVRPPASITTLAPES